VAFVASCARGINAALSTVDWAPGDAIITTDLEFPTVDLVATQLRARGVEVRRARSEYGAVHAAELAAHIDGRVRMAIVSLVSFKSGAQLDLPAVSAAFRSAGVPLLVDATQALGVVPFDAALADFVVSSCFKWLLGGHGVAILYVNARTSGARAPDYVGWRSVRDLFDPRRDERVDYWPDARRFEEGMPAFPSLYALDAGLETLGRHDAREVAHHARELCGRLRDGLVGLGFEPLTPPAADARAGIVAVADADCAEHVAALRDRGVIAWGRDGRLRVSAHLYNDDADVDRFLDAMSALTPSGGRT
jgi:selenocysteine lyase/cysteine desulfurase